MTTTTRSETPARRAKRVRINEDENEVEIIRVEKGTGTPSIAARNSVEAAVASHPEPIQRVIVAIAKDLLSLKAQLRQKLNTQDKLDHDADFVPCSARISFKLTATTSIMETDKFKMLASAMDEKTKQYSLECKKSIAAVAKLVNENLKEQVRGTFKKGLLQVCALLYIQQNPLSRDAAPSTKMGLYILNELEPAILSETFINKNKLIEELKRDLNDKTDTAAASTVVYSATEKLSFDMLKAEVKNILRIVFVDSISKFKSVIKEQETAKSLEKQAKEFLVGTATTATAMEIDSEPSATPALLREMVNEAVHNKTAKLQNELQKLRAGAKRGTTTKNDNRGASSSNTTQSASSKKKKGKEQPKSNDNANGKEKGKGKKNQQNQKKPVALDAPKGNDSGKGNNKKQKKSGTPSKGKNKRTTNSPRNHS